MFRRLYEIFRRFQDARLRLHPAKCHWAANRVNFLGHVFSDRGIEIDQSKFSIVMDFPVPKPPNQLRCFCGVVNYYRRLIKEFSQIFAPLRGFLKDAEFLWMPECQAAFDRLKEALIMAPVLAPPDFNRPFIS